MIKIEILFTKISKYMVGRKKYLAGFEITKKQSLTIVIIALVILIVGMITAYFAWTIAPISVFEALNKTSLYKEDFDKPYSWQNILFARLSSPDEPLNFRNVLIGIAGVITLIFAWRRLIIAGEQKETQVEQIKIESDRRLSERFDSAVTSLSKELDENSFPAHLGAISSLQTLAIDSPENTQRCLDIICSCNQWMEGHIDDFVGKGDESTYSSWLLKENNRIASKNQKGKITLLHEKRSQGALVSISNILTEISTSNPEQLCKLKFHNKMLCGISLNNLILDGIDFKNTYLVAASLDRTSLKQANLNSTNLQRASLHNAHLGGAYLRGAHLESASLDNVHLEGASLIWAYLEGASLMWAHLEGVSLDCAHLEGAYLGGANLQGASLHDVHLEGAYLVATHLEGASLDGSNLQEAILINSKLQGASLDKVNLSNAMLLSCNLYGAILEDIKSENIMFNDITNIGYIEDKKERRKWLDDVCKYMKSYDAELLVEKMEIAWQAMEDNKEPDGLERIREESVVNKNNEDMYDISEEGLNNLKKRLQEQVNQKDIESLLNMRHYISLMGRDKFGIASQIIDKNTNLVNKLQVLIDQLIKSNKII